MPFSDVITTHVLDTSKGIPAPGIRIVLQRNTSEIFSQYEWENFSETITNSDGRGPGLAPYSPTGASPLTAGTYKLIFFTGSYFAENSIPTFYPHVEVIFILSDASTHYHVPLLISPFGYSTYRGS
jgi:5-hydroxyisourate hydrolase